MHKLFAVYAFDVIGNLRLVVLNLYVVFVKFVHNSHLLIVIYN